MTPKELADQLNGCEYGSETTPDTENAAKDAGLVIVFGASDDLMEFRGAIDDEVGAPGKVMVDSKGILPDFGELCEDHDRPGLRDYFRREVHMRDIKAVWDTQGYSWVYETRIPHETFDVTRPDGVVLRIVEEPTL